MSEQLKHSRSDYLPLSDVSGAAEEPGAEDTNQTTRGCVGVF